MEYKDFLFKDIKYVNGESKDPKVTLKFSAQPIEGGPREDIKRKVPDLPHRSFRKIWKELIKYWKMNLEKLLSTEGGIEWDFEDIRMRQIKMKYKENGNVGFVKYYATISASFDEKETVPTPYMPPAMVEGEIGAIEELCSAAKDFLHGERDQQTMDFDDTVSEDPDDEEVVDLSGTF